MTTTMIARPAGNLLRNDVEQVVDWMTDLPAWVSKADCRGIMSRWVGHDVPAEQVWEAVDALIKRNHYRGTTAELDAQQQRLDVALSALLDARTPQQRVQDYAERTHDENPLTVAVECGTLLGHPVDVTALCDLAEALDDLAHSEDPREETLRQTRVDDATSKILNRLCAVQS